MFGPPYSVSSSRGLQGAERVPSRSIDVVMRTPFPCPCCWQPWARHARPQGRRGCQIVGRNPRVQIPKSVMQDALGAHQRLLVVEDSMLRRGHGCQGTPASATFYITPRASTAHVANTQLGDACRNNDSRATDRRGRQLCEHLRKKIRLVLDFLCTKTCELAAFRFVGPGGAPARYACPLPANAVPRRTSHCLSAQESELLRAERTVIHW